MRAEDHVRSQLLHLNLFDGTHVTIIKEDRESLTEVYSNPKQVYLHLYFCDLMRGNTYLELLLNSELSGTSFIPSTLQLLPLCPLLLERYLHLLFLLVKPTEHFL